MNIPVGALIEVADVLLENEITNNITGTNEEEDELVIEVQYEKEQREAIHQIEDIIADYEEEEDEDEEDEDEEDDK
ncbi:hypothetical protein [Chitinophaga eiseniae]|uniref:Uncharacterized protein n=1 Tax=Chitinophaga eiseniae TaxID=634771 RepID=A0A847SGL0_9BACT|nr:hypothetical protein [Chitinophaga eiseniae]NLR80951.1 hypothetical protein [Chitinophaga eiseniae]